MSDPGMTGSAPDAAAAAEPARTAGGPTANGVASDASATRRVGFIGLGMMGAPMAGRLAKAGAQLAVYDIERDRVAAFARRTGARACVTPAEVAAFSEVVITMLPTGATVAQVVLGDGDAAGVLAGMSEGGLIVDMSSAAPAETRALGARIAQDGVRMVDAPVSGGVAGAEAGTLTIIAGGEPGDVAACREIFEAIGGRTIHTGPLGTGHAAKAINNAVSATGLIAAGEALIVGQRAGVDPEVMLEVLNASSGSNHATKNKIAQQVFSRAFASGFALSLMAKDLEIAERLADSEEVDSELLSRSSRLAAAADGALGKGADHTAIVRWLEERNATVLDPGADRGPADLQAQEKGN